MPRFYIAQIKENDEPIRALTQPEMEAEVARRIICWRNVIADTTIGSVMSLLMAMLLMTSALLIFAPSAVVMLAVLATYYKYVAHEYNPLAHRWYAQRRKQAWEVELARISNLDSRLPYATLPPNL